MDYNARFYSPLLGRFIQPDTIIPNPGDSQAWNRYSYTSNNPIKFVDPTGHMPEGPCGFHGCRKPKLPTPDDGDGGGGITNQPGNINGDVADYPAFDPASAPEWMPDFMAEAYLYAQNAIWVLKNPNATAEQKAFAGAVLAGYIIGYGGLLVGASMLGYAAAEAILNAIGLACVGSPTCATLLGLGGTGGAGAVEAACDDGDCTNEVQQFLPPSDARFTQDSISPYTRGNPQVWLDQLTQEIDNGYFRGTLRVVQVDGVNWFLDNRRLAGFVLLDQPIPVTFVDLENPIIYQTFIRHFTTVTQGLSIVVSGTDIVITIP